MLDLLRLREEAIVTYKNVVDLLILDSGWVTGLCNLKYEPTISGYAERRMKEPFIRLENQTKN
jgi:hypothetical protein